jgi:hypothetical protein
MPRIIKIKVLKVLSLVFLVLISLFACCKCKKDNYEITIKLSALKLLQNKWTPISSWIFFPDGSKYQLLTPEAVIFTSAGKQINYDFENDTIIQGYQLLSDDSTLIFSQLINGTFQVTRGDTATISNLTNHQLVYFMKTNNIVSFIDSLKR